MTWMRRGLRTAGLIGVLLFCASAGAAPPDGSGPAKRAEIEARLLRWRAQTLRSKVGLDENKAREVERLLDGFRPQRQRVQQDLAKQRRALRALIDLDSNDDGAYRSALQALRSDMQQLTALRVREFDELAKLLTPKQQAKLAQALFQAEAKLRHALRKAHHDEDDPDDD